MNAYEKGRKYEEEGGHWAGLDLLELSYPFLQFHIKLVLTDLFNVNLNLYHSIVDVHMSLMHTTSEKSEK